VVRDERVHRFVFLYGRTLQHEQLQVEQLYFSLTPFRDDICVSWVLCRSDATHLNDCLQFAVGVCLAATSDPNKPGKTWMDTTARQTIAYGTLTASKSLLFKAHIVLTDSIH
jgi:hypothetical protein